MSIEAGQQLLHYRLIEPIGEGGMGVVWRAEDTTLHREVAIKVLPPGVAGDEERLARFGREARSLATLNHPNIASIYGFHETQGVHFLAMELVRGEDLAQRIARGPLPLDDALEIARAVGEALRAAHGNGVIHRDLKPANIRIGPEGEVKVLDFGLAKMFAPDGDPSSASASLSLSPTVTSLGTVAGVLLGTAGYMSPEQARGKSVDRRADVWAFGCVLFEMLTGKRAFPGETITDTLAAVVRAEPEWDRLPATLPAASRRVLQLCLAKDARRRLHDIADALLLMEGTPDTADGAKGDAAVPATPRLREGLAWGLAGVAIVLAVLLGLRPGSTTTPAEPTRFTIRLDTGAGLAFSDEAILAIRPDGRAVAFVAVDPETGQPALWLRTLDQRDPWPLPGTAGASGPFFSPDGEHLGFFADSQLRRIPVRGGSAIPLAEAPNPRGGVWLPDDTIVYSPAYTSGLWRVPAKGGTPQELLALDASQSERTYRWPTILPDGDTLLFTVGATYNPNNYDDATIMGCSLRTGARRMLIENASMARVLPPDRIVFLRSGALYEATVDPARLVLTGDPNRVLEGVGGDPSSGIGYYDVSRNGDLAYVSGAMTDAKANVVVVDPEGTASLLPLEPRGYHQPRFSPDGSRLAFTIGRGSIGVGGDVWVYSFADRGIRRVTFSGSDMFPVWQPDGAEMAFLRSSDSSIVATATAGGGEEKVLFEGAPNVPLANSWSPDRRLVSITLTAARRTDAVLLEVDSGELRVLAEDASSPMISPDGRWVAYAAPAAGNSSVYVQPVEGKGKWQISPKLAGYPRWSRDGRRLFFIDLGPVERPLMAVDVSDGETFRFSMPYTVIPDLSRYVTSTAPLINWDSDGERFAFIELVREDDSQERVEVVLDWK